MIIFLIIINWVLKFGYQLDIVQTDFSKVLDKADHKKFFAFGFQFYHAYWYFLFISWLRNKKFVCNDFSTFPLLLLQKSLKAHIIKNSCRSLIDWFTDYKFFNYIFTWNTLGLIGRLSSRKWTSLSSAGF